MIYFDNAATTPMSDEVISCLNQLNQENFANPSSLHSLGMKSKNLLREARETLAKKINSEAQEIFFLSGATEANNLVFAGLYDQYDHVITSPSEHSSVIEPVKYVAGKNAAKKITYLDLDQEGFINLDQLENLLKEDSEKKTKTLVSIMHGNSEIGTLQDLEAIGQLCKRYNAIFHSDCVQTFCKFDIDVKKLNLDLISISAHKIFGPKGIGFVYKSKDLEIDPLIWGGGQEDALRSGTENINSILAMAKAVETYPSLGQLHKLEESLIDQLSQLKLESDEPAVIFNGAKDLKKKIPGIINISIMSKLRSEQIVLRLDLAGIAVSSGSACSSSKRSLKNGENTQFEEAAIESSYVLRACKIPEEIASRAIRVSLSSFNTPNELEELVNTIKGLL